MGDVEDETYMVGRFVGSPNHPSLELHCSAVAGNLRCVLLEQDEEVSDSKSLGRRAGKGIGDQDRSFTVWAVYKF